MSVPVRPRAAAIRGAAPAPGEPNELDDATTQDKIMDPKPLAVKVSDGGQLGIYELAARPRHRFVGFALEIYADALRSDGGDMPRAVFSVRLAGVLSARYRDRLLPWVALALNPPGTEVTDTQLASVVKDLDGQCNEVDLLRLFTKLSDLHGVEEVLKDLPNA